MSDSNYRYGFVRWNDYSILYQIGGCVKWGIVYRRLTTDPWSVILIDPLSNEVDCSTVKPLSDVVISSEYTLCPVNKEHENTFALLISSLPTLQLSNFITKDIDECLATLPTKGGADGEFIGASLIMSMLKDLGDNNAVVLNGFPVCDMLDEHITIKQNADRTNNRRTHTVGLPRITSDALQMQWLTDKLQIMMPTCPELSSEVTS